ncbi:uncharacterized protein LOC110902664 isoform X2 [Helianthus annuus]|uniref:uncharacterized protein LOC110902664 isoform X2 n=1 Tax=Helianthus annuus TaxID=4232 RepID=UPI000B8FA5F7|nr:uncharacterized protein LOC110902664 isoform X2 [Helianthus annuus]
MATSPVKEEDRFDKLGIQVTDLLIFFFDRQISERERARERERERLKTVVVAVHGEDDGGCFVEKRLRRQKIRVPRPLLSSDNVPTKLGDS